MSDSNSPPSSSPVTDDRSVSVHYQVSQPDTQAYVGDCRDVLESLPERGNVDLIFADPPFNWSVAYEQWDDSMPREDYEEFTRAWLDKCIDVLAPHGSMWVNIPDDSAAEIVMHLKQRGMHMINWCIWHFRFGQHRDGGGERQNYQQRCAKSGRNASPG